MLKSIWNKWKIFLLTIGVYCLGGTYLLFYDRLPFQIPCPIHLVTGIPCPGCGMTRAFHCIINWNIVEALHENILSIFLFVFLFILPFWIFIDTYKGTESLYCVMRSRWNKPAIVIATVLLVLSWIWNIFKEISFSYQIILNN